MALIIVNLWLFGINSFIKSLNIILRSGKEELLSTSMRLDIHPLTEFCLSLLGSGIYLAYFHWFLEFSWENKILKGRDKILGVKLRTILHLQFLILVVVCRAASAY